MNVSTPLPQLSLSEALKEATSKVTQFTGRARRSEYWWTYLVVFILNLLLSWTPILGGIVMLVFMCQDSQPFENKYGPSPKYKDTDENNGRF